MSLQKHHKAPVRRDEGARPSFPIKPVCHLKLRTHDALGPFNFDKLSISAQPKGSHSPPNREHELAQAIRAKRCMVQETLWRIEEELKRNMERDNANQKPEDGKQMKSRRDQLRNPHEEQGGREERMDSGVTRRPQVEARRNEEFHDSDEDNGGEASQKMATRSRQAKSCRGAATTTRARPSVPPGSPSVRAQRETPTPFQEVLCRICNRTFFRKRIEQHEKICKKLQNSHREVFDSSASRMKGTLLEEYRKFHDPEVYTKTKNWKQKGKGSDLSKSQLNSPPNMTKVDQDQGGYGAQHTGSEAD